MQLETDSKNLTASSFTFGDDPQHPQCPGGVRFARHAAGAEPEGARVCGEG